LLHVPVPWAQARRWTALLSGTVQARWRRPPGTLKAAGRRRPRCGCCKLGRRAASQVSPNLPTFGELGYKDVEFYIWAGLFAQEARCRRPLMTRVLREGDGGRR